MPFVLFLQIYTQKLSVAHAEDISAAPPSHVQNVHGSFSVLLCMQNNFVGFLTNVKLNMMQVMLLGHSDSYVKDKAMQVTIAFNHFGEGLIQRMPR
jgi:pectate lyase